MAFSLMFLYIKPKVVSVDPGIKNNYSLREVSGILCEYHHPSSWDGYSSGGFHFSVIDLN